MVNLTAIKIKDLPAGEFFKRKPDAQKVYTRDEYDRSEKRYVCGDWSDISRALYLKGETIVYIGFDF